MSVKAFQIIDLNVYSTACQVDNSNKNIKASLYCPFVKGIHRSPVDSHHK